MRDMEVLGVNQQRSGMRKPGSKGNTLVKKNKKKPIKVVYISNPMRVEASAAEFRALVQQLTGRDAHPPGPPDFPNLGGWEASGTGAPELMAGDGALDLDPAAVVDGSCGERDVVLAETSDDISFNPLDEAEDVFMPLMMENFGGWVPSRWVYETAKIGMF